MREPFKIIGHRGACGHALENTLISFQRAIDLGVKWVEFDVRLSKDGVPVVIHDANLTRVFGNRSRVDQSSVHHLQGQGVPSLDTVLNLLEANQVGAYVEIKESTTQGLNEILARVQKDGAPRIVSSFHHPFLRHIRAQNKEITLQPLFSAIPLRRPAYLDDLGAIELGVSVAKLLSTRGARILEWGFPVSSYTVNTLAQAQAVERLGGVGIFSDYPDRVKV